MARKRKGDPVHGWLALFKPEEITSTQCVSRLKRLFNAQKAGHGGTLDPLADGILPIAFGEATKTSQWAMDGDKEYVFTIEFGKMTETLDREGEVIATSEVRPTREEIETALKDFIGDIDQVPPKYSAIKIDGARAYDLARDGEEFEIPTRTVTVFETSLIDMPDADHAVIHVRSGKGFYVRAMARDLAQACGSEGYVSQLRRTRVGPMDEASSVTLAELEAMTDKAELMAMLAPIETVLEDVPQLAITSVDASQIRQGRQIVLLPHVMDQWRADLGDSDDRLTLAMDGDTAIALGEVRAGRFQPSKVFQH